MTEEGVSEVQRELVAKEKERTDSSYTVTTRSLPSLTDTVAYSCKGYRLPSTSTLTPFSRSARCKSQSHDFSKTRQGLKGRTRRDSSYTTDDRLEPNA